MANQTYHDTLAYTETDGTAVANTTTETIVAPAVTLAGGYLRNGRSLPLTAFGRISSTATPTVRFRLRLGGVAGSILWDTGTITLNNGTAAPWWIQVLLQTRANGASGKVFAGGFAIIGAAAAPTVASATGAPAIAIGGSAGDDTPAEVTVDLTANQDIVLTAQWSAAAAGNTLTGHLHHIDTKM